MTENETPIVLNVLLTLWQAAITREETLKLILKDMVPDWQYRYRDYWNDAETLEFVMNRMAPMREVVKAAIQGELTDALLQQAVVEMQRPPDFAR